MRRTCGKLKKGIIFDIQRFSLHDGPGIRTTVFFKGCPLHCIWCHNPESWMMQPQLMMGKDKTGGHPKLTGREMSVAEVMEEVCADKSYYQNSGGGLTVSGGEPMLQPEFLRCLLEEAREEGIHTCIETSGFAQEEEFVRIKDTVDLFLFDIKDMNEEGHKKYVGVSQETILHNLDYLYQEGAHILIRCPVIPGINDTDAHIAGVAGLTEKYPDLEGVEIMPYHDMGKGKWEQIGRKYALPDLKTMEEEQKELILSRFQKAGVRKVRIS